MDTYLLIKTIHIVSATILVGTGLGTAFFLHMAARSQNIQAIRITTRNVVMADWLFTAPTVLIQPATGIILMNTSGMPYESSWFYWVAGLYLIAGACWIPVVGIQYRLRAIVDKTQEDAQLPENWYRLMGLWRTLGYVAFACVLGLFYLMVYRPGL